MSEEEKRGAATARQKIKDREAATIKAKELPASRIDPATGKAKRGRPAKSKAQPTTASPPKTTTASPPEATKKRPPSTVQKSKLELKSRAQTMTGGHSEAKALSKQKKEGITKLQSRMKAHLLKGKKDEAASIILSRLRGDATRKTAKEKKEASSIILSRLRGDAVRREREIERQREENPQIKDLPYEIQMEILNTGSQRAYDAYHKKDLIREFLKKRHREINEPGWILAREENERRQIRMDARIEERARAYQERQDIELDMPPIYGATYEIPRGTPVATGTPARTPERPITQEEIRAIKYNEHRRRQAILNESRRPITQEEIDTTQLIPDRPLPQAPVEDSLLQTLATYGLGTAGVLTGALGTAAGGLTSAAIAYPAATTAGIIGTAAATKYAYDYLFPSDPVEEVRMENVNNENIDDKLNTESITYKMQTSTQDFKPKMMMTTDAMPYTEIDMNQRFINARNKRQANVLNRQGIVQDGELNKTQYDKAIEDRYEAKRQIEYRLQHVVRIDEDVRTPNTAILLSY